MISGELNISEAYRNYAAYLSKKVTKLTLEEKTIALLNHVIENSNPDADNPTGV